MFCGTRCCCFCWSARACSLPIRLRGVQVRRFGEGFRRVFGGFTLRGKKADAEGMSSFQALTTAIAAQVGTGNITGCATALVSGGPGALFWTWVSAFFGMATIYAEAVLAQHYKTTVNGHVTGGPAYYIRAAFKGKVGKVLAHGVLGTHHSGAGLHGQHGTVQLHR